jgi:hypothetical protein
MSNKNPSPENRFTSTNQPSNESKRVKKYKLKLKQYFNDNLPVIEDQMKKGNFQFWQACKEWVYGKEVEKVEHSGSVKSDLSEEELDNLIKDKLSLIQKAKN